MFFITTRFFRFIRKPLENEPKIVINFCIVSRCSSVRGFIKIFLHLYMSGQTEYYNQILVGSLGRVVRDYQKFCGFFFRPFRKVQTDKIYKSFNRFPFISCCFCCKRCFPHKAVLRHNAILKKQIIDANQAIFIPPTKSHHIILYE